MKRLSIMIIGPSTLMMLAACGKEETLPASYYATSARPTAAPEVAVDTPSTKKAAKAVKVAPAQPPKPAAIAIILSTDPGSGPSDLATPAPRAYLNFRKISKLSFQPRNKLRCFTFRYHR